MTDPLATIFQNMDRWRHLPAYQLERRADILFSAYVPAVVEEHTGVEVSPNVIPELPIKRDLIWPDRPTKASVKVDYVVFARGRSKVFFVELKTDSASRRKNQDTYLERAVSVGFAGILHGIVDISQATRAHQKYGHLLHALEDRGCLRLPEDLDGLLWPTVGSGLGKLLREIDITVGEDEFEIEVIYVQPTGGEGAERIIDFHEFAAHVEQHDDPISQRFARSLREWVAAAGTERPA